MTRQQILKAILGVVVVAGLFEWGWLPYQKLRGERMAAVRSAEETFRWVESSTSALQTSPVHKQGRVTTEVVEQSMSREGLRERVKRLEPRGDQLQITLADAPFAQIVQWLALVEGELSLRVVSFTFSAASDDGYIGGVVVLAGLKN